MTVMKCHGTEENPRNKEGGMGLLVYSFSFLFIIFAHVLSLLSFVSCLAKFNCTLTVDSDRPDDITGDQDDN